MRHIDSPELFGVGCGGGTSGDITCEFCNTPYNEGADEAGDFHDRDSIRFTSFADLTICECCFERVEDEIERRMPDILRWYRAIVERRRAELARDITQLDAIGLERPIR